MAFLDRISGAARYLFTGRTRPSASTLQALHEAASSSRRLKGWMPTDAHINTVLKQAGGQLVRRSRDLVRTNGYAASAMESFVASLVGTGIKPSVLLPDVELREEVKTLWRRWVNECDADGATNFYGIQTICGIGVFEAGEGFVRFRPRRLDDGLSVPLQLQALEAEQLDRNYNLALPNGNQIRCGIEFDRIGRRVAYHFWKQHPGDTTFMTQSMERTRVPAEDVMHVYDVRRPGQIRGIPRTLPAIVKLFLLDQYDDAELDRKKVAALVAAFITKSEEGSFWTNEVEQSDPNNSDLTEAIAEWEPGMIQELGPGEDVKFSTPSDVGANYESFQYRNLLSIGAGLGVTYSGMTGDMVKANYSNTRAALLEFRRRIAPTQNTVMIHQFCRVVWNRFIESAILAGHIAGDAVVLKESVKWIPPRWEWVDPLKDREAEQLAVDAGFKALSDVQEAEGNDPEETAARIAADQERFERYGIKKPAPRDPAASNSYATDPDAEKPAEDDNPDEMEDAA